ncbi:nucleic acid binding protein, putative [Ricinus communis]|uniref:Nucleic acid binding protein, putative n=1 Tax=Ricinus communis TaxID=3988 RepID=B9S8Y3_RICCO|nr:nucleic acid binding protein, putative [Ricinus communis]
MLNSFWWGSKRMDGRRAWRLVENPDLLVGKLYKARYYPNGDFLSSLLGTNPSYIWASLQQVRDLICKGVQWKIGKGTEVSIGLHEWLLDASNGFIETNLPDELRLQPVCSLLKPGTCDWDQEILNDLFSERDKNLINSIVLSPTVGTDQLFWFKDPKGKFSVKDVYRVQQPDFSVLYPSNVVVWRRLWKLNIAAKCKVFMWRALTNRLPVRTNLVMRKVTEDSSCPCCVSQPETIMHILVLCDVTTQSWKYVNLYQFLSQVSNLLEGARSVFEHFDDSIVASFVVLWWSLWTNMNDVVWNGKKLSWRAVASRASSFLFQWGKARKLTDYHQLGRHFAGGDCLWQKPATGKYKLNVDASSSAERGKSGASFVLRDNAGIWITGVLIIRPYIANPDVAEAWALKEALSWIHAKGMEEVQIETDCLRNIELLEEELHPNSYLLCLLKDCQDLLRVLNRCNLVFVYGSANTVAHMISKATCSAHMFD